MKEDLAAAAPTLASCPQPCTPQPHLQPGMIWIASSVVAYPAWLHYPASPASHSSVHSCVSIAMHATFWATELILLACIDVEDETHASSCPLCFLRTHVSIDMHCRHNRPYQGGRLSRVRPLSQNVPEVNVCTFSQGLVWHARLTNPSCIVTHLAPAAALVQLHYSRQISRELLTTCCTSGHLAQCFASHCLQREILPTSPVPRLIACIGDKHHHTIRCISGLDFGYFWHEQHQACAWHKRLVVAIVVLREDRVAATAED